MKLTDLEGTFLVFETEHRAGEKFPRVSHRLIGDRLDGAHGVMFLCPLCYAKNGGPTGTHSVICWFEGRVPDSASPKPGRWHPAGTGLADLTFVPPGAVSVQLLGGCGWHGFVRNGDAS